MTQIDRLLGIMKRLRDPENRLPVGQRADIRDHRPVHA
ncbi:MazG family protein [Enterobacter cancerogenus]|uniref:MazG family protein n=1 Tax=Enterobacter cancerogenus TaxID=69218 RepID=A0A484Z6U5_9ENTR|nr:MazG family protein [Enterobacter cancerogenus]